MNPGAATASHLHRSATGWSPALVGPDGERALHWALRLADELRWVDSTRLSPWLGDGAAGLAVLFATLTATFGAPGFGAPTDRYLSLAGDHLTGHGRWGTGGLFAGLTGVAWAESVVSRLRGDGPIGSGDVDALVTEMLAASDPGPGPRAWGLTTGLVGLGVYAMERAEADPRLLDLVLARLGDARSAAHGWVVNDADADAEADADPHRGCPVGVRVPAGRGRHVALGMAGGLAGIVAFSALAARGAAARPLLAEAAGALLAHQPSPGEAAVLTGLPVPVAADAGARLPTWCGGPAGVAAALVVARPLLTHPQVPQALSAALDAIPAGRAHELAELGLCHGLAGVAHVLHRAAVAHQREQAWTAAGDWGRALLARLDAGDRPTGWGFQNGSAGVILALLALTTDVAPVWDRALLLS